MQQARRTTAGASEPDLEAASLLELFQFQSNNMYLSISLSLCSVCYRLLDTSQANVMIQHCVLAQLPSVSENDVTGLRKTPLFLVLRVNID